MSWQMLYWNQEEVREALQRGEYDGASLMSWARLDDLIALAERMGVLKELHGIHPELTQEGSIPRRFIHPALFLRTMVGDESLSALQERLFCNAGVSRLLGCMAREIREGFALEHNRGEHTPCHVDSLRYSLKQTPAPPPASPVGPETVEKVPWTPGPGGLSAQPSAHGRCTDLGPGPQNDPHLGLSN